MSDMLNKNSWIRAIEDFRNTANRVFDNIQNKRGVQSSEFKEGTKRYREKQKKGLMNPARTDKYDLKNLGLDYDGDNISSAADYGLSGYLSSTENVDMMNLENPSDLENELAKFRGAAPFGEMEDRLGDLKLEVPKALRGVFKDEKQWKGFKNAIRSIESNVYGYNSVNGSYDGAYQMGYSAKKDAYDYLKKIGGLSKGEKFIGHTKKARESFRADPELQERYYSAFVQSNYKRLMKSKVFKDLSQDDKIGVLAYAQLGATAAKNYIEKGEVKLDANNFSGTSFIERVKDALDLNVTDREVFLNNYLENLKPKPRPEVMPTQSKNIYRPLMRPKVQ